jgi:hypothetical protein
MIKQGLDEKVVNGKHFHLVPTKDPRRKLLIREIVDKRKGPMEQTMVPELLKIPTLRMHH